MTPDQPFWQSILLEAVGPLVTILVGTVIVGSIAELITRRAQERREDYQTRMRLIDRMTETASALYLATQRYWRGRDREQADQARMTGLRLEMDAQYQATRVEGEVLERQLLILFSTAEPRLLWHSTMDLLTVRYFQLIKLATDELLKRNAGPEHSFLAVEELKNPQKVLDAYGARIDEATRAVLATPLVRPAGWWARLFG